MLVADRFVTGGSVKLSVIFVTRCGSSACGVLGFKINYSLMMTVMVLAIVSRFESVFVSSQVISK